jgi:hypothetical protein
MRNPKTVYRATADQYLINVHARVLRIAFETLPSERTPFQTAIVNAEVLRRASMRP